MAAEWPSAHRVTTLRRRHSIEPFPLKQLRCQLQVLLQLRRSVTVFAV
jgi:hypothetical protein